MRGQALVARPRRAGRSFEVHTLSRLRERVRRQAAGEGRADSGLAGSTRPSYNQTFVPQPADKPAPPRAFAVELFLDNLRFERGLSEKTLEAYQHDVVRLAEFARAQGRTGPRDVSTADLRAFLL